MSAPPLVDRGTALRIRTEIRDANDALSNPDTITCEIIGPSGSTYSSATAMTNSSTGVFLFEKQTSESDPTGIYTIIVRATSNNLTSLVREDGFTLE